MNNKTKIFKLARFLKGHWIFLSLYIFVFILIYIGVHLYLTDEIRRSEDTINDRLKRFEGQGECYRKKTSYTIVEYKKTEKPDITAKDSSAYEQMYGSFEDYYVATSKPWNFVLYKKFDKGIIFASCINPYAVGLSFSKPKDAFKKLYNNIQNGYQVSNSDFSISSINSDFHSLSRTSNDGSEDIAWYDDSYGERLFFTEKVFAIYRVKEDFDKVQRYFFIGISIFAIIETLLFALFWYVKKKWKSVIAKFKIKKQSIYSKNPTKEKEISDLEYELLLRKIHPNNFMNPYDAEKVRIANDLYSALLKSKGNQTIIHLIEEKAKSSLKIESSF